ncbi:HutD protein [Clostridium acidisoli DSM 12555]|jgi:environmental stress-induced protein Ves|uniref:HutD protein n=1 Tax=Clostridium acidisoli DSM 12555 TaxID=1121291 RepID=A0A1W1XGV1_9CLOT|nr:HutD family protein [Clostridium acidisoli]SMC22741.1 HutD protein [Clostridium acidisoli DSM 12555]
MNYKIEIIKKENYNVSKWSGGRTTELYIYPKTAKYNNRDFKWRISTATVEVEESIFTRLEGFSRKLMVTEGKTVLAHEGMYNITLNPFEKDSFMGDWTTKSYGKASDFNLMTAKECIGALDVLTIKAESEVSIEFQRTDTEISDFFYILGGNIEILMGNEKFYIEEKDLFCITYVSISEKIEFINKNYNEIKIIRAKVTDKF